MNMWDRFWKGKNGKVAVWQTPNLLLIIWFVTMIAAKIVTTEPTHAWLKDISTGSILIWAVLEIAAGASYFRRVLGLVVLVLTVLLHLLF